MEAWVWLCDWIDGYCIMEGLSTGSTGIGDCVGTGIR
jgi:hypothetical protein